MSAPIRVIEAFARAASSYDSRADAQIVAADKLGAYMEANTRDRDLVPGDILEVGCGTGLFTRRLLEMFDNRKSVITDICPEMLLRCQQKFAGRKDIEFALRDASETSDARYALIVAAFALQWVDDLESCLTVLAGQLADNGKLFFSVPSQGSFAEWKSLCIRAGVPFTGNELPTATRFRETALRLGLRLSLYEESIKVSYPSVHQFLQSFKSLGANTALQSKTLTVKDVRRLIDCGKIANPNSFEVTYNVLFGNFTRLP